VATRTPDTAATGCGLLGVFAVVIWRVRLGNCHDYHDDW